MLQVVEFEDEREREILLLSLEVIFDLYDQENITFSCNTCESD